MMGDEEANGPSGRENSDWTRRRDWTHRLTGLVPYTRFTALNAGGVKRLFFSFDLPGNQDSLPDAVYAVMKEHQTDDKGYPTGLKVTRDKIHGKCWTIADDERGRAVADRVDACLQVIGEKKDYDRNQGR